MTRSNEPSLNNVVFPGQYTPFLKSNVGTIFYMTWAIFIGIGMSIYFAVQEKMLSIPSTTLYILIGSIVFVGIFIADRIQFVFNSQGALILYPSGIDFKKNTITGKETDSKVGTLKGSGVHASYSFWVYDEDVTSANERGLLTRQYYSESDLYTVDVNGNKTPKPGITQFMSNQPSILLSANNHIIYSMQDPSSSNSQDVKRFQSVYTIPRKQWTNVQIVQTQNDVSIYLNNKLDSVHTFPDIESPDLIAKGPIVLFPEGKDEFNGVLSRIYYWNRSISPSTQSKVYNIGPVQGSLPYEILKSILVIPHTLIRSIFVS